MKFFKPFTIATLFLITGSIFTACKKNDVASNKPDCRIITATASSSASNSFNMNYNSEGKISGISNGNDVTTFAYSGNTVIATTNTSGTFSSRKIITINAGGFASNLKTEYDAAGTSWSNEAYEYSGTELIKATSTSSSGGAPSISILTWSDGNLVSLISGSNTTTLDYYNDKSAQTGDYLDLAQLVQGYRIYKTKNLLKSILSGSTINSFNYDFASDGYISAVTVSGPSSTKYTYQYQCN